MKANIPPFYIGQKVVYIGKSNNGYVYNKTYTVSGIKFIACCNKWAVSVGIPVPKGMTNMCDCSLKHRLDNNGMIGLNHDLHKPIQEQSYPLMSFSKIVEREKEEVLINN